MLVISQDKEYLLMAEEQEDNSKVLTSLFEFPVSDYSLMWNGTALKLGPETFVAWEKGEYSLKHGRQARYDYEIMPAYERFANGNIPNRDSRIFLYLDQNYARYQLSLTCSNSWECEMKVILKVNAEEIFSLKTKAQGALILNDTQGALYYTDFQPYSSGMNLIAYDLENKKQLWKSALQGLGPISHSKYINGGADLRFWDDGVIEVMGKETAGSYVELVDPTTGKTIANKKFLQPQDGIPTYD